MGPPRQNHCEILYLHQSPGPPQSPGGLALVLRAGQTLGQGGCCRPQAQSAPALAHCWVSTGRAMPLGLPLPTSPQGRDRGRLFPELRLSWIFLTGWERQRAECIGHLCPGIVVKSLGFDTKWTPVWYLADFCFPIAESGLHICPCEASC